MLDLQSTDFKSKDELREIAPSIFSTKPSPEVSSKYSHIPTDKLIDDMDLLGWKVIDAKEVQSGITVHFVNNNYDEGSVVFQELYLVKI